MIAKTHKLADKREIVVDAPIEGGQYNVYDCPGPDGLPDRVIGGVYKPGTVGHYLLSLDVDDGVTPAMITCPDDGRAASSRFYPPGPPPAQLFPVRMIWRKATNGELKRERREGGQHYALGGLAREWVTR